MKQNSIPQTDPARSSLQATLTYREVKVLRRRFGLDTFEIDDDDMLSIIGFLPRGDDGGSQGGAPLNAVEALPVPFENGKDDTRYLKKRRR